MVDEVTQGDTQILPDNAGDQGGPDQKLGPIMMFIIMVSVMSATLLFITRVCVANGIK